MSDLMAKTIPASARAVVDRRAERFSFQKVNSNPGKRKRSDCVVRALSLACRVPWLGVFDDLTLLARQIYAMPNEKDVYSDYLRFKGWVKQPMPRFADNTRYTVREFAAKYSRGTYVLSVANHLTVIIDGTLYDTWDCGGKSVGNFWSKGRVA